jgi:DNA repair protein RecO
MLTEITGLVLKNIDIGESDRLITVFTKEMGTVSALVKGARSIKNRHMSSTQQFCYSSMILYSKGDKFWVRESNLIESFFGIRKSIEGLSLAGYIVEVLSDVTTTEAETDLLRLALNCLYAISEEKYSLEKIKAAFEIRAASILGFMPDVLSCSACGEKGGNFYFDIMGGSIKCYACCEKERQAHTEPESPHESHIVRILSESAKIALCYCIYAPIEKIFSFNVPDEDMELFAGACEDYLINQLAEYLCSLEACSAMLYCSDHGEDLFDDGRGMFLHSSPRVTYYQLHIPCLVWLSAKYRESYPTKVALLQQHRWSPASTSAIFHTLADIASIDSPYVDRSKSLSSVEFDESAERLYLGDGNCAECIDSRIGVTILDRREFLLHGIRDI